jgi:hypothetical protein
MSLDVNKHGDMTTNFHVSLNSDGQQFQQNQQNK